MGENESKKATNIEKRTRLHEIYEMCVKGATKPFIVRYASENWGIGERSVEKYLVEVAKMIEETFGKRERETLVNETLARLSDLYIKNYEREDFRECRNVLETRSKLLGLNEADLLKLQGDKDNPVFVSRITITDVDGTEI